MMQFYRILHGRVLPVAGLTAYPGNSVHLRLGPVPGGARLRLTSSSPTQVSITVRRRAPGQAAAAPAGANPLDTPTERTTDSIARTTLSEYSVVLRVGAGAAPLQGHGVMIRAHAITPRHPSADAAMAVDIGATLGLPAADTPAGLLARLLICEAHPANAAALPDARAAMALMRQVIANRASAISTGKAQRSTFNTATGTALGVVTAPGQFDGFENYPELRHDRQREIDDIVRLANNSDDPRADFNRDFINAVLAVANAPARPDAWPAGPYFWRTANSGPPLAGAILLQTVGGNSFYGMKP